jgi:hypothetical protein
MTRAAADAVAAYFAASAPDADDAREEDPSETDVEAAIAEDALDE